MNVSEFIIHQLKIFLLRSIIANYFPWMLFNYDKYGKLVLYGNSSPYHALNRSIKNICF